MKTTPQLTLKLPVLYNNKRYLWLSIWQQNRAVEITVKHTYWISEGLFTSTPPVQ